VTSLSETLDLIRDGAVPRDLESEQLEFKQEESADPRRSLAMLADATLERFDAVLADRLVARLRKGR